MLNSIRKSISNFIYPRTDNATKIGNQFLRYGQKKMGSDWTQVIIDDRDLYTGYSYAAIRNRANYVARIAKDFVKTLSKSGEIKHPYLELIEKSGNFSEYDFWFKISTYLDLEGVFYLMAVRNFENNRFGKVKRFRLLSPYNVRRVLDLKSLSSDGQIIVKGYVEAKSGFVREIPPQMIIEMRELNPFSDDEPFAMTDAAKEEQFTIKTASDFTRHTLKHNINAPGLLSTDVTLTDPEFENFVSRVKNHTKGEPIFGNGKGAITWDSMNIDLSKSALKDVNELNREALFSVAGVSKTTMGIEQSGTTRETARVQKELLIENHILPRIQLILDSLNLDYKTKYSLKNNGDSGNVDLMMFVDSPLEADHEADLKEVEVKKEKSGLYTELILKGYDPETVADYVLGEIDIDQLGEPDLSLVESEPERQSFIFNQLDQDSSLLIQDQQGSLESAVININGQMVAGILARINKKQLNQFEDEFEIITKTDKKQFVNDLSAVLLGFYGVVMSVQASRVMSKRVGKFSLPGLFTFDSDVKKYIKSTASKVAQGHIDTIVNEIWNVAKKGAEAGLGIDEISRDIRKKYSESVSKVRAKTIARSETNRAFTRAQYEADRQFIEQNKLRKRAFKQWITRSDDPCPFCLSLEAEGKIPFDQPFRNLGDTVEVDDKILDVGFETLKAGNAHPNCSCSYELIIESVDNSLVAKEAELSKKEIALNRKKKEIEKLTDELCQV